MIDPTLRVQSSSSPSTVPRPATPVPSSVPRPATPATGASPSTHQPPPLSTEEPDVSGEEYLFSRIFCPDGTEYRFPDDLFHTSPMPPSPISVHSPTSGTRLRSLSVSPIPDFEDLVASLAKHPLPALPKAPPKAKAKVQKASKVPLLPTVPPPAESAGHGKRVRKVAPSKEITVLTVDKNGHPIMDANGNPIKLKAPRKRKTNGKGDSSNFLIVNVNCLEYMKHVESLDHILETIGTTSRWMGFVWPDMFSVILFTTYALMRTQNQTNTAEAPQPYAAQQRAGPVGSWFFISQDLQNWSRTGPNREPKWSSICAVTLFKTAGMALEWWEDLIVECSIEGSFRGLSVLVGPSAEHLTPPVGHHLHPSAPVANIDQHIDVIIAITLVSFTCHIAISRVVFSFPARGLQPILLLPQLLLLLAAEMPALQNQNRTERTGSDGSVLVLVRFSRRGNGSGSSSQQKAREPD
ncbi:hypothetical protein FPV67DRAFT_1450221 [Lyophyllum atratum]|nr:hypothetical protein FPV67DRAFT_1450221 [Lyophyllum atratum]